VDFRAAVAELEALVQTLEREGDERALMLLQLVDAIHRPALARIAAGDLENPLARALLAMYDLAPVDEELDVEEALDEVRPYIQSHGGDVELLGVEDGVVHVRLSGACQGCAGSAMTLRRGIEAALREHYEGFRELVAHEVSGPQPPETELLTLENNLKRPVFVDACASSELAAGELRAVVVDDVPVLLANVDGEVYAVKNRCPVDGMPLEGGRLTEAVLVCPWHNCAFDVRSGRRLDEPEQPGLSVVPIALQDGAVRVAVNVA
jgi:nitrite reductase/ring-hydroxylating ferredoxin subunit/Fe-S cluster biogenesis protein NfuA